jgi:putative two-component system response regulator
VRSTDGAGRKVLIVDDLVENTDVLRALLRPQGYSIEAVHCGVDALERVASNPPDVILLDLMMPGIDGIEVCRRIKLDPASRHIPIIIITGSSDRESNLRALEVGADDFVTKPFDRTLLEARLRSCLRSKALQDELFEYQRSLEDKVAERTKQVRHTQQITVFALARLAESRDNETGDHLERMRCYARALSEEMARWEKFAGVITEEFIEELYQSTPLHDIGKVGIPDQILLKPGKLSPHEFTIMQTHTTIGGDTLKSADLEAGQDSFLAMGRDVAYAHHEKWDGSGYPNGLAGEAIPLPARIAALADVYDALSSKRPYKEPFTHERSKEIILEGRGSHFDPDVVDAFLNCEPVFVDIRARFKGMGRLAPIQELVEAADRARDATSR